MKNIKTERTETHVLPKRAKSLAAYFSRRGMNIKSSGDLIDLPVGNTEVVAQMIQEATGSDRFRIKAVNPYPEDYHTTTEVAKEEQRSNARPALTAHVENMNAYDVIFVGYPNWWGAIPCDRTSSASARERKRYEPRGVLRSVRTRFHPIVG